MSDERGRGDDGPDPEEDRALAALLREASGAPEDAAAAALVADGAWIRARGSPRREGRSILRRAAWAAAAAAGVLGAAALPGGAPAAFAVEGGTVQVWGGDAWESARRVPVDRWVFAGASGSGLVGPAAEARLRPGAGALFRISGPWSGPESWSVEVAGGSLEVEGPVRAHAAGAVRVRPSPGSGAFAAFIDLEMPAAGPPAVPGPLSPERLARAAPVVSAVRGDALVCLLATFQEVLLGPGERASIPGGCRLASLAPWEQGVSRRILLGDGPVDAFAAPDGSLRLLLRGTPGLWRAFEVPGDRVHDVLEEVNLAAGFASRRIGRAEMRVDVRVGGGVRDVVHEGGGRRTRLVLGGALLLLERDGVLEEFHGAADLRARRPEEAALFAAHLPR